MKEKLKVMIVEDEAIPAMLYKKKFEDAGFEVLKIATNSEQAIEVVKTIKPDLILMDIRLSGAVDGIETACLINEYHDIPIIFMTGYSSEVLKKKAQMLNPLGYYTKPFNIGHIIKEIQERLLHQDKRKED